MCTIPTPVPQIVAVLLVTAPQLVPMESHRLRVLLQGSVKEEAHGACN